MDERAKSWTTIGRNAILAESEALVQLAHSLDHDFANAVELILACAGKVVISGIGKSGHIARKIASTFASTGTPAVYLHPSEASHGDLGVIDKRDLVIAISRSGESPELADILAYCRRFAIPLVAITANRASTLGGACNVVLLLPAVAEVCPMGLAPTTSTTMVLALGDALAVACIEAKEFKASAFREFHPGGKLGKKLLRVSDVMHGQADLPLVSGPTTVRQAVIEMSRARLGCVGVIDDARRLVGIFTDGDLRRNLSAEILEHPIARYMSAAPSRIAPDALLADATSLMEHKRIPSIFVVQDDAIVGIIHMHDLLSRGII
jgi:arabinose-5-phosphate isomerase